MDWTKKDQICLECKKTFRPWRNREIKYCSKECRRRYLDRRHKGYLQDGRPCEVCGEPMIRKKGQLRGRLFYCSDKCSNKGKYLKDKQSGAVKKWRLARKVRLLGRPLPEECEICGTPFKEVIVFPEGSTLRRSAYHIDHIEPKSKGGADDPANMICVCWFCNEVKGDSRIPFKAIAETAQLFWKLMQECIS